MFLKIQFLESQKRWLKLFKDFPPSTIYVFVKRISCYRNDDRSIKGSAVCYAWFVWDKEYDGETNSRSLSDTVRDGDNGVFYTEDDKIKYILEHILTNKVLTGNEYYELPNSKKEKLKSKSAALFITLYR